MIIVRILAQLVDLSVAVLLLIFSFTVALPAISIVIPGLASVAKAALLFVIIIFLIAAVQFPFLKVGQTVGKGFFGLEVISTNPDRPLTASILFQREVFGKLMSCYFICIPVLFGKIGGHDKACETTVVYRSRVKRSRAE